MVTIDTLCLKEEADTETKKNSQKESNSRLFIEQQQKQN
jgi:hypothetical protein